MGGAEQRHVRGRPRRKEKRFRDALELARRFGDSDLEFVTLAYLGASLVHADRTEEGMVLLDEALAAVAGSEVDDFCVLQEIFCQLFSACEHARRRRADQWIRIGEAIAERRRLPAVSAFCRTHYGGVLTAAGRWPEADAALTEAVRLWGLGHRSLRGGALARLADLRVRQGRFEEAEQLLDGLAGQMDAARPLAAIQLAKGETSLAKDTLERALEQVDPLGSAVAPLLSLLVDVHLAANALDEADAAVQQLEACAARHRSDYLAASAALARGRVCLAAGTGDPQACLREALAGFDRAQMPMEVAHSRLELANALVTDRPEVAMVEARAALEAFERLHAARRGRRDRGVAVARGAVVDRRQGWRAADQARGGGARAPRPRPVEPGDLGPPLHQSQDGRAPRRQHPLEARPAEPGRSHRLRGPGESRGAIGEFPDAPGLRSAHCASNEATLEDDTMTTEYDAIVVGARCAGAPTAMLLARKGYRVLVVDRASFPSDTLSTHMIHAPGVAALKRWGVLDTVTATGCPPIETYSFDFGPFTIAGTPRPCDGISTGYAPRRTVLDKILVDAAAHAGAEVRERFTVDEVVVEDGAVVGIRGHGEDGKTCSSAPAS